MNGKNLIFFSEKKDSKIKKSDVYLCNYVYAIEGII